MILEAIVTTMDEQGRVNIAPMGPRVDEGLTRFELRLFRASQTYRNLVMFGEGVVHVSDDVLLYARGALDRFEFVPDTDDAKCVRGRVLRDACRWFEFRVTNRDESDERVRFELDIVHQENGRPFFGFNRAKHAVIEAAILATRFHLLPVEEIRHEFARLEMVVAKTGGKREHEAFALLVQALHSRGA